MSVLQAGRAPRVAARGRRCITGFDVVPLVVLRKLTFGHRTIAGARRMARLMTVQETAQRFGHKGRDFFYYLYTHPPDRALRRLCRRPKATRRSQPNNP